MNDIFNSTLTREKKLLFVLPLTEVVTLNIALVTDDVGIDSKMKGYLCLDTRIKSNNISVHSFDEIVPLLFF